MFATQNSVQPPIQNSPNVKTKSPSLRRKIKAFEEKLQQNKVPGSKHVAAPLAQAYEDLLQPNVNQLAAKPLYVPDLQKRTTIAVKHNKVDFFESVSEDKDSSSDGSDKSPAGPSLDEDDPPIKQRNIADYHEETKV